MYTHQLIQFPLRLVFNCQFSQEKMKSQSPVCHQKQQSRHTNSMDVKTILTQRGIDTLGLLLLYEIDPELTRATHTSEIQSKTTFTLSIY